MISGSPDGRPPRAASCRRISRPRAATVYRFRADPGAAVTGAAPVIRVGTSGAASGPLPKRCTHVYMPADWTEDRETQRCDPSADPGAETGAGAKLYFAPLLSLPPPSALLRDRRESVQPPQQDAVESSTGCRGTMVDISSGDAAIKSAYGWQASRTVGQVQPPSPATKFRAEPRCCVGLAHR